MFIAALGEVSWWLRSCQLSGHSSINAGAFWDLRPTNLSWWRWSMGSVFCEGDRRKAELWLATLILTVVMVVVAVVSSTLCLFLKVRKFDVGFDRAARFLTPSRVESTDKRSILCLQSPPIDRARSQLSKTPLIAFQRPILAEIGRIRWIRRK